MKISLCILAGLGLLMAVPGTRAAEGDNNVKFHGTLVNEPCVIPAGEENISLSFGTVAEKMLYAHTRTPGSAFAIHLTNCNTKIAKTVRVRFGGRESGALPGLLAPDADSEAGGIAIGLEMADGSALKLNTASRQQVLSDGENVIRLSAYVAGEPRALADRGLKEGAFRATGTFTLAYE